MTNKNPFEIRLDMLQMAKDMLDAQYSTYQTMAWDAFTRAVETNKDLYKDVSKYVPKMYTPEEVIAQAEKFQQFINKKD